MTPAIAASIVEYLRLSRPFLHVTAGGAPMPTVTVSAAPEGPVLVWAFGGCVYGPDPRPTDKGTAFTSGYECVNPYRPGLIFDPIAGPFDDDETGLQLLAAVINALPEWAAIRPEKA